MSHISYMSCIHIHTHIYMYVYIYIYMYIYVCIYIYTNNFYTYRHTHIYIYTRAYSFGHVGTWSIHGTGDFQLPTWISWLQPPSARFLVKRACGAAASHAPPRMMRSVDPLTMWWSLAAGWFKSMGKVWEKCSLSWRSCRMAILRRLVRYFGSQMNVIE